MGETTAKFRMPGRGERRGTSRGGYKSEVFIAAAIAQESDDIPWADDDLLDELDFDAPRESRLTPPPGALPHLRLIPRSSLPPPLPKRPARPPAPAILAADYAIETSINDTSRSSFYQGRTDDVSAGGLFVATILLVQVGTRVDVTFTLPDDNPPIRACGIVRWVRERPKGPDAPVGYGVEFLDLSAAAKQRIGAFVRRRELLPCGSV